MSMSSGITGVRRVKVWQADAEWPDDTYVVPAEDLDVVTTDRDTKAANLQLLVEKVLGVEAIVGDGDEYQCAISAAIDFARGLKQ